MKTTRIAFAAAMLAAAPAFADTVVIDDFVFTPAKPLSVSAPNYTGKAGQFTGLLNGDSFVTYCTDLLQNFKFDVVYTSYSVVDGATAWGAQKSWALDKLMSAAIASAEPAGAGQSAAIQAAVWEVLYEAPQNAFDFSSGSFTATSTDATTQGFLSSLNWGYVAAAAVTHHADQLYSPDRQDFLVLTAVPEPSTYLLLAAGLVGIGFAVRRRSIQA